MSTIKRTPEGRLFDPAFPNAEWVDDGRPSRIVPVRDLQPGDVLLGWYGEPFDLGTVHSVETYFAPSPGPAAPSRRWVVNLVDESGARAYIAGSPLWNGDSPRRVAGAGTE
jgi:hypothetical protein